MRPHLWITESRQFTALWILLAAVIVVGGVLDQFGPPGGWIPLEFPAWTTPKPGTAISEWAPKERDAAIFGLGIDSLFLVLYPLFLSLLCGRAAEHWSLPEWLARASGVFAGLVLLAAPLDALENAGLFRLVSGDNSESLQVFITAVAAPKWFLAIATGIVWIACVVVNFWPGRKENTRR